MVRIQALQHQLPNQELVARERGHSRPEASPCYQEIPWEWHLPIRASLCLLVHRDVLIQLLELEALSSVYLYRLHRVRSLHPAEKQIDCAVPIFQD